MNNTIDAIKNRVIRYFIPEDPSLRIPVLIAFLLRVVPLLVWLDWPCVRDECTYLRLSDRMVHGEGMTASNGWIWAPGYPFLLAVHQVLFGYAAGIKTTQSILSVVFMNLIYRLAFRFSGDKRVAKWALLFYAFSPTQIFFAQSLWSECIYGGLLLVALDFFHRAYHQEESSTGFFVYKDSIVTGILVGICVLFRGVATYMLPIFAFALLWQQWRRLFVYKQAIMLMLSAILVVAPYSLYASKKFDGFMISDRTLGQMMWLGNNDFAPITFDWGNGQLSNFAYQRHIAIGREPCAGRNKPVERDVCQTQEGVAWIKTHPQAFLERIPVRIAQMFNPHSFITRHIRWGNWLGLPQFVDECIVVINVLWNLAVLWLGTWGLLRFAKTGNLILIAGIWLYHIVAISMLAGLTRYRVPLEPFLMIYVGYVVVYGKKDIQENRRSLRFIGAVLATLLVAFFTLWFMPSGWVEWRHW